LLSSFLNSNSSNYNHNHNDDDDDDVHYSYLQQNLMWMLLWFCTMVVFIVLPFCTSKLRREMCMRGIRERRWIGAEEFEAEENALIESRNRESRRLHREETQREFQISGTQEDEIRHQYVALLMQNYTILLRNCDICDCGGRGTEEISAEDLDLNQTTTATATATATSIDDKQKESTKKNNNNNNNSNDDVENQCGAAIESGETNHTVKLNNGSTYKSTSTSTCTDTYITEDPPETAKEKKKRSNSEDSDDNLPKFVSDTDQMVRVPLAGLAVETETEQADSTRTQVVNRRVVSNGCAICLCPFEEGEEVTWSSNPDCSHVFHSDCILHWYLAYGRKTQKRRLRNNPNMTDAEALDLICKFPILCPCCRQTFCIEVDR